MANSSAWDLVGDFEDVKVLLATIEQERQLIKLHAYRGTDTLEIYRAANRQREAIDKLIARIEKGYKKALRQARK